MSFRGDGWVHIEIHGDNYDKAIEDFADSLAKRCDNKNLSEYTEEERNIWIERAQHLFREFS